MHSRPRRSSEPRTAVRIAVRKRGLWGSGMNLVAINTEDLRSGSDASNLPIMRSLSPLPYTSAVSKSVTPAASEASHACSIEASVRAESYPPIPQVSRSPQAQVPTPRGATAELHPTKLMVLEPRSGCAAGYICRTVEAIQLSVLTQCWR